MKRHNIQLALAGFRDFYQSVYRCKRLPRQEGIDLEIKMLRNYYVAHSILQNTSSWSIKNLFCHDVKYGGNDSIAQGFQWHPRGSLVQRF